MKSMFEMSMVGELTYFLGLQVKQTDSGIYINQAKYARNLVKIFGLDNATYSRTPMAANVKLTNDPSGESCGCYIIQKYDWMLVIFDC